MTDEKFTKAERDALLAAEKYPNGWGFFMPRTTEKLAERGFFEKDRHPYFGMQWRITEAGRKAAEKFNDRS